MGHFRSCTSMGEPYALVLVVTCRGMNSASLRRPPNAFCGIVNISQNCSRQLRNITRIYNKTVFFHVMPPQIKSPWDIAVQNQGGWAPKTGSFYTGVSLCGWAPLGRVVILYRSQGVKLELGGLRFILYTRASLVHMVLGVLILYWFPFYAKLEARLGVQSLYYAKIHPKIKPLFLFFHCEAWGSWYYTDVCIYRIL